MLHAAAPDYPNPAPAPAPGLDPGVDPGIALRLPVDAYYYLVRTLRLALPPPPTDDPEDVVRRDHAAVARIAALVPANAAEAELAAQFVAASEYWKDCLRLANLAETGEPPDAASAPQWAAKCRAQGRAMMRQANDALRLLLRLQAAREKRDADQVTRDRAAWVEHCALSLMAEALEPRPAPVVGAAPPPREPEPQAPVACHDKKGAGSSERPSSDSERIPANPAHRQGKLAGLSRSGLIHHRTSPGR